MKDTTAMPTHPLDQTMYVVQLVREFERASHDAVSALGDPDLDDGVRAAGFKHVCAAFAQTATRLDDEAVRRPVRYDDRARWDGFAGRLQRLWQRLDAAGHSLSDWAVGVARSIPASPAFQASWWLTGLVVTLVAAGLLVTEHYLLAGLTILARWIGSLIAGGPTVAATNPGLVAIEHQSSLRRHLLTSCVASHAADLVVVGAAGLALYKGGAPGWALGTMAAGGFASYATLFRIAAERNGIPVRRSVLERIARNGGIAVAVVASWISGGSATTGDLPPLGVVGLAFAVYGLAETLRVGMALVYDPSPEVAIMISVDEDDLPRITGIRRERLRIAS